MHKEMTDLFNYLMKDLVAFYECFKTELAKHSLTERTLKNNFIELAFLSTLQSSEIMSVIVLFSLKIVCTWILSGPKCVCGLAQSLGLCDGKDQV